MGSKVQNKVNTQLWCKRRMAIRTIFAYVCMHINNLRGVAAFGNADGHACKEEGSSAPLTLG